MKNILLINPRYEMELKRISDEEHMDIKADATPLGLVTVAALTSEEFQVDIWDEFIRGYIEDSDCHHKYHLVGITGSSVSLFRAVEISAFFRQRGIPVAIGGPGVSATPDRYRGSFDILFIGEAELTWPKFLHDWQTGKYRLEYRQIEKPDISLSPIPKWDRLIPYLDKYALGSVQTTRGCPYDCEFCDVIYLHGRTQRHKSIDRVLEEVRIIERLGMSAIYLTDDNFVIDHRYSRDLLRELIPLNNSFDRPLRYITQGSIDVCRDDELLELLADVNLFEICIGIESPNIESLREVGKYNNLKVNLVEAIQKIQSYGIAVRGSLICGLDHDGNDIFDRQYELIQKSFLPAVNPNLLIAPIGTRLWRRLRQENRVVDIFKITNKVTKRFITNVIPKLMTRVELMQGYRDLYAKIYSWESFKERMIGFVSLSNRPPKVRQTQVSLQELTNLGTTFHLDPEVCRAINDIFSYTDQKAPYLLKRVKDLVIQFIVHSKSANTLIPKLDQQIEIESSGKLTFEFDNRPISVLQGFRSVYQSIFPDVHRRVYLNLSDKDRVSEALMEVFVEFLVKESCIEQIEGHHMPLLNEIIDRTCARLNGQRLEDFVPVENPDEPVPNTKRIRLGEDVLNSVEQELLRLSQV